MNKKLIWMWAAWMLPACALLAAANPAAQPEAEFYPVVKQYLDRLAAGQYEEALALVDQRGMANFLVERRLDEMRAANPDLTAEEAEALAAQFREKEVHPDRIREVLLAVMKEQKAEGMTWTIKGVSIPEAFPNARLINYTRSWADRPAQDAPLTVQKVGPAWYVAPQVFEAMTMPQPVKKMALPAEAQTCVEQFWAYWRDGAMDQAHDLFTPDLKTKIPLLNFLENAQKMMQQLGLLESWRLADSGELPNKHVLAAMELKFTKGPARSILNLEQIGGQWRVANFQFMAPKQMLPAPDAPAAAPVKDAPASTPAVAPQ